MVGASFPQPVGAVFCTCDWCPAHRRHKAARSASRSALLPRSMPRSWMKANMCAPSAACIASWTHTKYRPVFPERFGSLQDARAFCQPFFRWYNHEHHHSGIALLTPEVVHYGRSQEVIQRRQETLQEAYRSNPERHHRHRRRLGSIRRSRDRRTRRCSLIYAARCLTIVDTFRVQSDCVLYPSLRRAPNLQRK